MESMVKPTAMLEVPGYGTFEIGEYGKPDGEPYFFIPGFLGSLHQAMLLDSDAKQLNMRIIGINKPGVGLSPFQEMHSAREFGTAVVHLADTMHIERFGLMGLSLGCHLALGVAAVAGNRVTATSITGMLPPMDDESLTKEMTAWRHRLLRNHERYTSALQKLFSALSSLTHAFPELMIPVMLVYYARFSPAILGTVRAKRMLRKDISDVFLSDTCVQSLLQELRMTRKWGFALSEIKTPVLVLHGEHDTIAPIGPVRRLVALIPNTTCMFIPGDHVSVVRSAASALHTLKNLSHGKKMPAEDSLQTEAGARPILALLPRWKML